MKVYHKQRMHTDFEYAARVKINATNRRLKFAAKGGNKLYWKNNKEEFSKSKVLYYQENKEKLAAYNCARKPQRNETRRKNYNDPLVKLKNNVRCLITTGIKKAGYTKRSKLTEILGCSFDHFKKYFEDQFTEGMTWKNIHCDHIIPISLAKTEAQVLSLSNHRNFRPCFSMENMSKSAKVDLVLISKYGLIELYNSLLKTG